MCLHRTLRALSLRSDQTDLVFGCSHISQPVLAHLACCPHLRQLTISSAELMAVDLSALSCLTALEVRGCQRLCSVSPIAFLPSHKEALQEPCLASPALQFAAMYGHGTCPGIKACMQ